MMANINNEAYLQTSALIQNNSFAGESGLKKALDISKEIGHLFHKRAIDGPKYLELRDALESKVVSAQKGTAILPFIHYIVLSNKEIALTKEYKASLEEIKKAEKQATKQWLQNIPHTLSTLTQLTKESSAYERERSQGINKRLEEHQQISREKNLLLDPIINDLNLQIETENESQGFIFRIVNEKGRHHYLIGTIHNATPSMAKSPALMYVIDRADRLILENASPVLRAIHRIRQMQISNPFRDSVDLRLYDLAYSKGIPIESLESITEQVTAQWKTIVGDATLAEMPALYDLATLAYDHAKPILSEKLNNYFKAIRTDSYFDSFKAWGSYVVAPSLWILKKELELIKWLAFGKDNLPPSPEQLMKHALVDIWQSGDTNLLSQFPSPPELFAKRNYKWLNSDDGVEGICERLQSEEETICYAVGAGHLVLGKPSILDELSKIPNLTIEQGSFDHYNSTMHWSTYC